MKKKEKKVELLFVGRKLSKVEISKHVMIMSRIIYFNYDIAKSVWNQLRETN